MTLLRTVLAATTLAIGWCALALFGALEGWWLEPIAPKGEIAAFAEAAAARVDQAGRGSVGLAIIEDGELRETHYLGADRAIDGRTLFPVASLGKWVTAYGVMLLAQDGRIDLDAPASTYLDRWQLPDPAPGLSNGGVTVRRLLSHTAGLTDGLGFADYTDEAPPPGLVAALADPKASSGESRRLQVNLEPGTAWEYSGGGYLILELLVEDVTGLPFDDYMQRAVFDPIGMERSTYAPLSTLANTSGSWTREGTPAPLYRYVAKGATGLASTVTDLARFARAQHLGSPLERTWVETMREPLGHVFGQPIWGAGAMLFAEDGRGDFLFGHDGANDPSINASVRIDPASGDGVVVVSTGPALLASELGYEWGLWRRGRPDFLQTGRALNSALAPLVIGLVLIVAGAVTALAVARRRRRRVAGP